VKLGFLFFSLVRLLRHRRGSGSRALLRTSTTCARIPSNLSRSVCIVLAYFNSLHAVFFPVEVSIILFFLQFEEDLVFRCGSSWFRSHRAKCLPRLCPVGTRSRRSLDSSELQLRLFSHVSQSLLLTTICFVFTVFGSRLEARVVYRRLVWSFGLGFDLGLTVLVSRSAYTSRLVKKDLQTVSGRATYSIASKLQIAMLTTCET